MNENHGSLRDKIAAEKDQRDELHRRWQQELDPAYMRALQAGEGIAPRPMVVYEADGLSDRPAPGGKMWYEAEGVCGFAWVNLYAQKGGESRKFINWLTGKTKSNFPPPWKASRKYGGGFQIWVSDHGQSMQRKERHAESLAESIRALNVDGLQVYAGSRLD